MHATGQQRAALVHLAAARRGIAGHSTAIGRIEAISTATGQTYEKKSQVR